MIRFLLKKTAEIGFTVLGITLLSFLIIHLAPGKPTDVLTDLNPKITPEMRERLEKYYGLDKPMGIQYWQWLKRIVRFDFGESFATDRRPVWEKIRERIPVTLGINVLSLLLILAVAIPIGILSAVKRYSLFDKATTLFVFVGFATPSFWLALILMIVFGVNLRLLPISGITSLNFDSMSPLEKVADLGRHLALPVLVSAFGGLAGISRYMRSSMLEVMRQDYITTARAKGLTERSVTYRHALRNALLPIVTILGLSVPGLIGGSVIFEQIFGIPGMGLLFYMSVMMRDYPVVMGILTIGAVLTVAGNLMADLSYALVDPRVRKG